MTYPAVKKWTFQLRDKPKASVERILFGSPSLGETSGASRNCSAVRERSGACVCVEKRRGKEGMKEEEKKKTKKKLFQPTDATGTAVFRLSALPDSPRWTNNPAQKTEEWE